MASCGGFDHIHPQPPQPLQHQRPLARQRRSAPTATGNPGHAVRLGWRQAYPVPHHAWSQRSPDGAAPAAPRFRPSVRPRSGRRNRKTARSANGVSACAVSVASARVKLASRGHIIQFRRRRLQAVEGAGIGDEGGQQLRLVGKAEQGHPVPALQRHESWPPRRRKPRGRCAAARPPARTLPARNRTQRRSGCRARPRSRGPSSLVWRALALPVDPAAVHAGVIFAQCLELGAFAADAAGDDAELAVAEKSLQHRRADRRKIRPHPHRHRQCAVHLPHRQAKRAGPAQPQIAATCQCRAAPARRAGTGKTAAPASSGKGEAGAAVPPSRGSKPSAASGGAASLSRSISAVTRNCARLADLDIAVGGNIQSPRPAIPPASHRSAPPAAAPPRRQARRSSADGAVARHHHRHRGQRTSSATCAPGRDNGEGGQFHRASAVPRSVRSAERPDPPPAAPRSRQPG